jgi:hypothetical protein
MRIAS